MASEVLLQLDRQKPECCCAPAGPYHERVNRLLREEREPYFDGSLEVDYVKSFVELAKEIPQLPNNAIADFHAFLHYEKETNGAFPRGSILACAFEGVKRELLYYREPPYSEHGMVVLSEEPWKPSRYSAAALCNVEVVVAGKCPFQSLPATLCNVESIVAGKCPAVLKLMLCKSGVVSDLFVGDGDPEFINTAWWLKRCYRSIVDAWVFNTGRVSEIPDNELELLLGAAEALGHPGSIAAQMGDAARRELDRRRGPK
jgi:hypothetical protein